ncbi:MAG: hypothetical protein ACE5LC_00130 [Candidatus Aminicenantales bacterium]
MGSSKEKKIIQTRCPVCHSLLWVDSSTEEVIKLEKGKKRKDSLENLLLKEKKRREAFEHKFEATAELEKKRLEKTKEEFEKALSKLDSDKKSR